MSLKTYELKYKMSPKARKVYTAIQFHASASNAITNGQAFIRNNGYYNAVVLSAVERPDFKL